MQEEGRRGEGGGEECRKRGGGEKGEVRRGEEGRAERGEGEEANLMIHTMMPQLCRVLQTVHITKAAQA